MNEATEILLTQIENILNEYPVFFDLHLRVKKVVYNYLEYYESSDTTNSILLILKESPFYRWRRELKSIINS